MKLGKLDWYYNPSKSTTRLRKWVGDMRDRVKVQEATEHLLCVLNQGLGSPSTKALYRELKARVEQPNI